LARLKSEGLFERALVIVTADHGASYYAGLSKRTLQVENRVDVGNIPLLVKYPGQSAERVVDSLVRSIDIAPTIAAVLGLPPSAQMDGRDLRTLESGELDSVQIHSSEVPLATITREDIQVMRQRTIARKERLFPRRGHGPEDWFFPATEYDIVGQEVGNADPREKGGGPRADIWGKRAFRNLDLAQPVLPLRTMGKLQGLSATDSSVPLAIALNGRIAAVTWSYPKDDSVLFSAMLPQTFLRSGDNEIAVYAIGQADDGSIRLTLLGSN
jgi:hypothetical protein